MDLRFLLHCKTILQLCLYLLNSKQALFLVKTHSIFFLGGLLFLHDEYFTEDFKYGKNGGSNKYYHLFSVEWAIKNIISERKAIARAEIKVKP